MPSADDVTLGEVARNLDALAKRVDRGFERVEERFESLAMVHADVYLADRRADADRHSVTMERIDRIESGIQWLTRSIVVIVIGAIVTAILAAAGLPH